LPTKKTRKPSTLSRFQSWEMLPRLVSLDSSNILKILTPLEIALKLLKAKVKQTK